jgi:hypothetical protein
LARQVVAGSDYVEEARHGRIPALFGKELRNRAAKPAKLSGRPDDDCSMLTLRELAARSLREPTGVRTLAPVLTAGGSRQQ